MKFFLDTDLLVCDALQCRTAIGSGGLLAQELKREGDATTPIGSYYFRRVLYRQDRLQAPKTNLPCRAIAENDGWCDEPTDPAYNRPVLLPYKASAEILFRKDHVYDLLVVLGHNDSPPTPGLGSAIFLHLARKNYSPTRGCLTVNETDLRKILAIVDKSSTIKIAAN